MAMIEDIKKFVKDAFGIDLGVEESKPPKFGSRIITEGPSPGSGNNSRREKEQREREEEERRKEEEEEDKKDSWW